MNTMKIFWSLCVMVMVYSDMVLFTLVVRGEEGEIVRI